MHPTNAVARATLVSATTLLVTGLFFAFPSAAGAAGVPYTCKSSDVNTCVVTIPLTSNMNEQVTSSMPDSHPWYQSESNGTGPYTLTGPGNPDTYWNGVSGATQGTVWSAGLSTGSAEPASSNAVLTFSHVTPLAPPKPYSLLKVTAPRTATTGGRVTIVAVVRPVPARGHVILQRQAGAKWTNVAALVYVAAKHDWTVTFTWPYPKHTLRRYHVLATAAPGLLATPSGTFSILTG